MDDRTILDYLIENKSKMTKKHQAICDYLLENHSEISMMSVKELAQEVGVGTTTVLRFTQDLGYSSFFDLKKQFFEIHKTYASKWSRIQSSFDVDQDENSDKLIEDIWSENISVLKRTLTPQLLDSVHEAVDLLVESKHIHLAGSRPYRAMAVYMEALLTEFEPRVHQLSMDIDNILDRLILLNHEDVVVVIAFSPYSNRMIDVAEIAYKNRIPVILITDELSNPISQYAKIIMKVETSTKHFTVISLVTLIEAIVVEYGSRLAPQSGDNVETLADLLKEKSYLTGVDLNLNSKKFKR